MKHRFLLLTLCACALLACDSANPVAPSGTVLSMSANPIKIGLNGQSTITVTGFKPDANPLNPGTQIILSTDRGNLVHPTTGQQISIVEIDGNGQAVALLQADGRAGDAVVGASLSTAGGGGGGGDGGGTTTGASASVTIQIGESLDDQPTLIISANPTIVDVLEASTIEILGRNSDNTPVSRNLRIRLTSNLGTLHAEPDPTDTTAVINEVFTDENGEAIVYFKAGDQSGTGRVSAILGTSDETAVDLDIRDVVTDFSFLVEGDIPMPITGGDIQLTATVTNARNEGVRNILVRFGSTNSIGTFSPSGAVLSDSGGIASTTLTLSPTDAQGAGGSFQVSATVTINAVDETKSQTITVQQ